MICASVMPTSQKEALQLLGKALENGDLAELRIDLIPDLNLFEIINRFDKNRIIITNRKKDEGGSFEGDESNRISPLFQAIEHGFGFVDVELSSGKYVKALISKRNELKSETNIILSYHNFNETPSNIKGIFSKIENQGQDIIKIVTYAEDLSDNLIIKDLIRLATAHKKKIISFLMGERGEISRILCNSWGGFASYAPLKGENKTAPGQITIDILNEIYKANNLREDFDIFGLVGNPVKESIGYYVHNKLLSYHGYDGVYLNFLVDDLSKFMNSFKNFFSGLCVTMPYKESIIPFVDHIDPMAKKIGAINTISKTPDGLLGTNTDWLGALYAIEKVTEIKGKKVLILGAGGAGKAIAFGVDNRKGNMYISNRDMKKSEDLSKKLRAKTIPWEDRNDVDFDILINATKIGMSPGDEICPMEDSFFEKDLSGKTVFDAVYSPIYTKLLRLSREHGADIASGLDMYIGQAMAQFELWTGISPSIEKMEQFSKEALKLRGQ